MDDITAGLRVWAANQDPGVQAAVTLLIDHDHWLWHDEFLTECLIADRGLPAISFDAVARLSARRDTLAASEGQLAILRVAADLASGRWAVSVLDIRNRQLVVDAVTAAVLPART